mmetsp:Transcript_34652/g.113098  ORF Transcript_34652/g.113098 Transcript_34652/m.113098 type:complete len:222 (+) Transcript_34652:1-666(+)
MRGVLEAAVARQPRERAELEGERAGGGGAGDGRLGGRDAVAQVDRAVRDAGGRVERGQQPLGQVEREEQQAAVRIVRRLHQAQLRVGGQQVGREQAAERADGRLEEGDRLVHVEGEVLHHPPHTRLKLGAVPEQRERVEGVDQREREAAPPVLARAREREQHVGRERVCHVAVVPVVEERSHLLAKRDPLLARHHLGQSRMLEQEERQHQRHLCVHATCAP